MPRTHPPACQHCTLPKVPGRLWGWLCTLCDRRPAAIRKGAKP